MFTELPGSDPDLVLDQKQAFLIRFFNFFIILFKDRPQLVINREF